MHIYTIFSAKTTARKYNLRTLSYDIIKRDFVLYGSFLWQI